VAALKVANDNDFWNAAVMCAAKSAGGGPAIMPIVTSPAMMSMMTSYPSGASASVSASASTPARVAASRRFVALVIQAFSSFPERHGELPPVARLAPLLSV
jgi:hypothetical protein